VILRQKEKKEITEISRESEEITSEKKQLRRNGKIQTLTTMAILMLHILSQIKFDELCHPLQFSVLCPHFHYIWPFVDLESFHPSSLYRWRHLRYNMELIGE